MRCALGRLRWSAPIACALLLAIGAPAARADVGVSLSAGRVELIEELARGGSYTLPAIGVTNPGTEAAAYRMGVGYLQDQAEGRPTEAWFEFSPREFTLQPGGTQAVFTTIHVPTDARPEDYAALLRAQVAPAGEGARIGAAAAAVVSFTVKPSNPLEPWLLRAQTAAGRYAPWSYGVPTATLLLLGLWAASRRFAFSLRLERRA